MAKKFPIKPAHPDRICWGCDRYCPADQLACGNGSLATPHPSELFGDDWMDWGLDAPKDLPADGTGDGHREPAAPSKEPEEPPLDSTGPAVQPGP